MTRRFEPGTALTIELSDRHLLAHVIHAKREANGRWIIGCAFDRALSEQELRAVLEDRGSCLPPATAAAPHFLIIGAQRCGTTSLFEYLATHPDIAPPSVKEIHFFDAEYNKGEAWYRAQFPAPRNGCMTGEATPYYLFHPHAPKRVWDWNPNIKLIVLLRNPVDRAHSHYHHEVRLGTETSDFEAALRMEPQRLHGQVECILADEDYYSFNHNHFSYLSRGLYVQQLKAWRVSGFAQEQFLILKSEDLYQAPWTVYDKVTDFLGIRRCPLKNDLQHNKGTYRPLRSDLRQRLLKYFRRYNELLYEYVGRDFGWET
jgi:hypothetical protein